MCNLVVKAQNDALPGLGGGGTTGVSDEEGEYIVYQMRDGYGLSAGETFRLINTATGTFMRRTVRYQRPRDSVNLPRPPT